MRAENSAAAYFDFLRQNADGFCEVPLNLVIPVLLGLADEGMSAPNLLRRAVRAEKKRHELLATLEGWFEGRGRRQEFTSAVLCLPTRTWEDETLDPARTVHLFQGGDFAVLCKKHPSILFDPDHPLFALLNADTYWSDLVRMRIVRKDFQRAWDELRKAHRGFACVSKPSLQNPQSPSQDEIARCYGASTSCLEQLVVELYEAMSAAKLVPRKVGVSVDRSRRDKRPAQSYHTLITPAGLSLSLRFQEATEEGPNAFELLPAGLMVLKIGTVLREERSKKRRGRNTRKLTEYKKRHVD